MPGIGIVGPDGNQAAVSDDKELLVAGSISPPFIDQKIRPLRQFLTDDGLAAGTSSMSVDGSTTPVLYYLPADNDEDIYIATLSVIVGYGASAQPYQWADGAALTNGFQIGYDSGRGEQAVADGVQSNQELLRLALGVGVIPTAWELRGVGALNDYGYIVNIDLTKIMPPYGVKIDAGSDQRLFCNIRDNMTTATDSMNIIAYGFKRFK